MVPLQDLAFVIRQHEVARADLTPVEPMRIDEELPPIGLNGTAEVVIDAFIQSEPLRPAEGGGEVDSVLLK
jgi:hypothetical protein